MNEQSNNNNGQRSNNNKRRRRRRPSGGNGQGNPQNNNGQPRQAAPNQNQNNQQRSQDNNSGRPRTRRGGRNRRGRGGNNNSGRPQLTGVDLLRSKYLTMVEKHVETRRKYYDFFYRADPNQLRKLEREFSDSQADLLKYIDTLTDDQRKELFSDYRAYEDELEDRAYSTNHNIAPEPQKVEVEGPFDDPHVLESQKRANYKDDREESIGTIDDYKNYKGL